MKKKEIYNGNKIIANFMEVKNVRDYNLNGKYKCLIITEDDGYIDFVEGINILSYHDNWNTLMPVIDKIEELNDSKEHYQWQDIDNKNRSNFNGYEVDINYHECRIWLNLELDPSKIIAYTKAEKRIDAVFYAIVQFIQWHSKYTVVKQKSGVS